MRAVPRILYFACFVGLALVAAVAFDGVVRPSMATILTRAVFVAALCAAPGLVYRKLWPLAIVLVPVGSYLLLRTIMPVPITVEGIGGQYHFYTDALYEAVLFYENSYFPLPISESPALELLLAFTVYWLTAAAAFVALSFRRPLPGMALLLILVGFGMTVDASDRVWSAVFFIVLAACLLVLSRGIQHPGWRLREVALGGAVGAAAAAVSLALLVTTPSVAANPWQDWRTWDPFGGAESVYTFNWLQNYPELLNPANNEVVMRVESPSPSYWRANALDQFTGNAWVTSQAFLRRIVAERAGEDYTYEIPAADLAPPGETVAQEYSIQSVSTYYIFSGGDPRSLTVDRSVALFMNDMRSLRVGAALGPSLRYSLTAAIPTVIPSALAGLGAEYPRTLADYLTLPFEHAADLEGPDKDAAWREAMSDRSPGMRDWLDLYALNERIVGDATDPYQIALRIERYLRRFYAYSLQPPASDYASPYAAFLFDTRTGYCQHFAGAMALLLRYNGIPSRVAVGFATGEAESPGVYLVSKNNAHAWVETYFPTVGWLAFDPTPGRNLPTPGASSTSPGFVSPFVDSDLPASGGLMPELPPSNLSQGSGTEGGAGSDGGRSWWTTATWAPWVIGIIVAAVVWPLARSLWRHRRLRRGPWDRRLYASLALARAEVAEYGAPATAAQTLEELMQAVETHVGLKPDYGLSARADAVFFGGQAARPVDVERAESYRRAVRERLRKRHGWLRTVLVWYGVSRPSPRGARSGRFAAVPGVITRATGIQ